MPDTSSVTLIGGKFQWDDPLLIEQQLTDDEKMIRDTARHYAQEKLAPRILEWNRRETFDPVVMREMGELGFLGAQLEGYGCAGIGYVAYGLIMRELERVDTAFRSACSVQSALSMTPIYAYGSEAHRQKYLPKMAKGELLGCFGLTEPDHGSDPGSMKSRAKKVDGGYVLTGTKLWITHGSIADVAIVWAKLDGQICGFLVEKGTPGFHATDVKGMLSLRASVTSELSFQDCEVPEGNLLPRTAGLRSALSCLTEARYGIAWGAVGAAQACCEAALEYAKSRTQFGRPIGSFQLVQEKLVSMVSELTKAQLLCYRLGRLKEAGKLTPAQAALAKRDNVRMAIGVARAARELLGANGLVDEYHVMRHLANLEAVYTLDGTDHIQTLFVGRDITGVSALA